MLNFLTGLEITLHVAALTKLSSTSIDHLKLAFGIYRYLDLVLILSSPKIRTFS